MTTIPGPTVALAEALHKRHGGPRPWPGTQSSDELAAWLLVALREQGWHLVNAETLAAALHGLGDLCVDPEERDAVEHDRLAAGILDYFRLATDA